MAWHSPIVGRRTAGKWNPFKFQSHGMVRPISVRGILVTEGRARRRRVFVNKRGLAFISMKSLISTHTNSNTREGGGTRSVTEMLAPPELLTLTPRRSRCQSIAKSSRAGHSPRWRVSRLPGSRAPSLKKPKAYQTQAGSIITSFQTAGRSDITKEAMDVGPTTITDGRHPRDAFAMSNVPGLLCRWRSGGGRPAGLHGATAWRNSLSDLVVFGRRAGRYGGRNSPRPIMPMGTTLDNAQLQAIAKTALKPLMSALRRGILIIFSTACRSHQDLVGIVRTETELQQALTKSPSCTPSAENGASPATASTKTTGGTPPSMPSTTCLLVSEAITVAVDRRKRAAAAQFREYFPRCSDGNVKHHVNGERWRGCWFISVLLPPCPMSFHAVSAMK